MGAIKSTGRYASGYDSYRGLLFVTTNHDWPMKHLKDLPEGEGFRPLVRTI